MMFSRLSEFIVSIKEGSFIKIKDRYNAAVILSSFLKNQIKGLHPDNVLILGIPRGGVIMAEIISKKLHIPYDIKVVRKLRSPNNEELAIGAIIENGYMYLNNDIINSLNISKGYIKEEKIKQIREITLRNKLYEPYSKFTNLKEANEADEKKIKDKIVIVVDDGAASGATIMVILRWLKKNNPKKIIVAITVAPKETIKLLKTETKFIESILSPRNFTIVSEYYQDFKQITDEQVIETLKERIL